MLNNLSAPLKNKRFTALLIGQLTSRFGDSVMKIMLPLIVYSITNSLLSMSLVMSLMVIPEVFFLPFAGIIVDRFSRKKLMMISDIIRLTLLTLLTLCSITGLLNIFAIYFYALVAGGVSSIFEPSYSALKAQIFDENIRTSANALTEISNQLVSLIGPILGGFIASYHVYAFGFGFDALTFLVSVLCLLFISVDKPINSGMRFSFNSFVDELKEGFQEIMRHHFIKTTIFVSAFINIVLSSFLTISVPFFLKNQLNAPDYYYGILMTANGVGAILIAILFGSRQNWSKRGILTYLSMALVGLYIGALLLIHNFYFLIGLFVLAGATTMMLILIWNVVMQELISEKNFGKVASLDNFGSFTLLPLGYFLIGILSQNLGIVTMLKIESLGLLGIGLMFLFNKKIRNFN